EKKENLKDLYEIELLLSDNTSSLNVYRNLKNRKIDVHVDQRLIKITPDIEMLIDNNTEKISDDNMKYTTKITLQSYNTAEFIKNFIQECYDAYVQSYKKHDIVITEKNPIYYFKMKSLDPYSEENKKGELLF